MWAAQGEPSFYSPCSPRLNPKLPVSVIAFASLFQRGWLVTVRSLSVCVSSDLTALARHLFFLKRKPKTHIINCLPSHHSLERLVIFASTPQALQQSSSSTISSKHSEVLLSAYLFLSVNHPPWRGIGLTIATLAFQLLWPVLLR
jgi:hypothetical protein